MQKGGFISVFALKDADLISKCVEENYVLIFYHDMGNRYCFSKTTGNQGENGNERLID